MYTCYFRPPELTETEIEGFDCLTRRRFTDDFSPTPYLMKTELSENAGQKRQTLDH